MKQLIQSLKTGVTSLEEIPAPRARQGSVLIQSSRSLVSLGTERMLVEFGKSNLISKAFQQPEKVKQIWQKVRSEGLKQTIEAVFNKLDEPVPLGNCNVGRVIDVGEGVSEFKVGDRVASNGPHAEIVCVPKNLVAHIPNEVSDDEATFTVVGSIGLQGIRLLNPSLGETVVVIGLGLIGMLTAQLLISNGCRVIGVDIDQEKLNLCEQWGIIPFNPLAGNVVQFIENETMNNGADGVIITASAKTNDIISQAARMSRKRGRIILIGVVGLKINRSEFYSKELSFQVSCSYGPGRYDDNYEQKGQDYPFPFVRWTEKRNFEAILHSIRTGKLQVKELITEIEPITNFQNIYNNIGSRQSIATIFKYEREAFRDASNIILHKSIHYKGSKGVIGIIGAGNYTRMTMLPALKRSGACFKSIASAGGLNSATLAKKYGFMQSTTDYKTILNDEEIDLVFVTTRHDKHAFLASESLNAGKHVFVEKPLALNSKQLEQIIEAQKYADVTLTVGFNRRFSAHAQKVRNLIGGSPVNLTATINAGYLPGNSWVHDPEIGGGRIIGEACHFIDLFTFFTGSRVNTVCMNAMGRFPGENTDNASILLKYEDGSTGVINYFSNGSRDYPKERIEVYSQNRTIIIDNFKLTTAYGFGGFSKLRTAVDKGHNNQFRELIRRVQNGGEPLIPFDEIINTTKASFAALESLKNHSWIKII